jgi:hypothetical protein
MPCFINHESHTTNSGCRLSQSICESHEYIYLRKHLYLLDCKCYISKGTNTEKRAEIEEVEKSRCIKFSKDRI